MSGIYAVSEWIMRFSVINLLWILFNVPIAFIVISIVFANCSADILLLIPLLIILLPLLFFPATQAMFASTRDWVLKREEKGLIKGFWNYYKENYKNSMLAGIIFTVMWTIWYVDLYYFSMNNILIMFVIVFIGLLLFIYTINYFSVSVHYDLNLRTLLKNAFLITLGSPALSIAVLFITGIITIISTRFIVLIPFFSGSAIAFLCFSAFYRQYLKLHGKIN
ncbi:DUF624 domain-containing protein [Oceanobacillus piezotolerans]|uniref:DUF624 domain-containing protein n=2 Tax=Oceanobacillus piezotolerans TaxID=2448030 RepID=A0A498D992_9BACI|nr:DUF624 domain-containing protein [Oceanobacillus piezotolerans]